MAHTHTETSRTVHGSIISHMPNTLDAPPTTTPISPTHLVEVDRNENKVDTTEAKLCKDEEEVDCTPGGRGRDTIRLLPLATPTHQLCKGEEEVDCIPGRRGRDILRLLPLATPTHQLLSNSKSVSRLQFHQNVRM